MQYDTILNIMFVAATTAVIVTTVLYFIQGWETGNYRNINHFIKFCTARAFMVVLAIAMVGAGLLFINGWDSSARSWFVGWVGSMGILLICGAIHNRVYQK